MLTENQRRYVQNLLGHVESEVQEGIAALEGEDSLALFPRYSDYPDAVRIARLRAHLIRMRSVMRRFMEVQGIASEHAPPVDASWGFQTRMTLARNAVFELGPHHLRGYGPLDSQGEQDCRALMAELALLLDDIARELRREPLQLPPGAGSDALLAAVVAAIEHNHLLELRPSARDLLGTLQGKRCVEVAVLGRVSSGKSSLVNALLGEALLPVGAVPVTAVVTRMQYGDVLRLRAVDVEGREVEIALSDLTQYIAESGNADNRLRLREVVIDLPNSLLRDGVILTDTPGLGSLHPKASAHALTYLPRCDLGVIVIDAATTLSLQDMDLARALMQSHASYIVVLTKSDTVSSEALEEQRAYIQNAMSESLHEPVRVTDVSIDPCYRKHLQHWRDEVLRPALDDSLARSGQRARERLHSLARRVCILLQQASKAQERSSPSSSVASGATLAALSETESGLRRLIGDLSYRGASVVLNDVLAEVAQAQGPVTPHIHAVAGQLADEVVRDVVANLKEVAAPLGADTVVSMLRGAPPFSLGALEEPVELPSHGPTSWRKHQLQRVLKEAFYAPLQTGFQAYGQELATWLHEVTQSLRVSLGSDVLATHLSGPGDTSVLGDLERIEALLNDAPPAADANNVA